MKVLAKQCMQYDNVSAYLFFFVFFIYKYKSFEIDVCISFHLGTYWLDCGLIKTIRK